MNRRELFGVGVVGVGSLLFPRNLVGGENLERLGPNVELTPEALFRYARLVKAPLPEYEDIIAQDARWALNYAYSVLEGPFPLGESAIATSSQYSYEYAGIIGRFPLGEKAIATDGKNSLYYATCIIQSRFILGEAAIHSNAVCWKIYCEKFNISHELPGLFAGVHYHQHLVSILRAKKSRDFSKVR